MKKPELQSECYLGCTQHQWMSQREEGRSFHAGAGAEQSRAGLSCTALAGEHPSPSPSSFLASIFVLLAAREVSSQGTALTMPCPAQSPPKALPQPHPTDPIPLSMAPLPAEPAGDCSVIAWGQTLLEPLWPDADHPPSPGPAFFFFFLHHPGYTACLLTGRLLPGPDARGCRTSCSCPAVSWGCSMWHAAGALCTSREGRRMCRMALVLGRALSTSSACFSRFS